MEGYIYSPLNSNTKEVRFLVLHPGPAGSPITGHLENGTFDEANGIRDYEALSYTWGAPENMRSITLSDEGDKVLPVRSNLWFALEALRPRDESRILWIDAVCINQNDIQERNHQVQQMRDIYSRATQVLVWIGRSTRKSKIAMQFLREFEGFDRERRTTRWVRLARSAFKWAAMVNWSKAAYWQRVWIVQETVLAKIIQLIQGTEQVPWTCLADAVYLLDKIGSEKLYEPNKLFLQSTAVVIERQRQNQQLGTCYLSNLIRDCAGSICAVPHDKIYGFLGLATDCYDANFPVDYSKTLLEVHRDVITFHKDSSSRGTRQFRTEKESSTPRTSQSFGASELFNLSRLVAELFGFNPTNEVDVFQALASRCSTNYYLKPQHVSFNQVAPLGAISLLKEPGTREPDPRSPLGDIRLLPVGHPLSLDEFIQAVGVDPNDSRQDLFGYWDTVKIWQADDISYRDYHSEMQVLNIKSASSYTTSAAAESVIDSLRWTNGLSRLSADSSDSVNYQAEAGILFWSIDGWVGRVPSTAKVGDLLYQLPNSDVAVVVRPSNYHDRIIGTAATKSSGLGRRDVIDRFKLDPLRNKLPEAVKISLDMEIFQLLTTVWPKDVYNVYDTDNHSMS